MIGKLVGIVVFAVFVATAGADATPPRFAILNAEVLSAARAFASSGDPVMTTAVAHIREEAAAALKAGPFTVTDKTLLPPSGDKHDYVSLSIYFWPNPDTPDGLPYVQRDGEVNPEVSKYDSPKLGRMAGAVESLALAYWFTRDEAYARHAAELLRVFFLDPATRMNPNMNFAQGVPGRSEGENFGIIDSVSLATRVVDAVAILGRSKSWTSSDQAGLERWFWAYTDWLQHSKLASYERRQFNNHGMWYDAQISAYAILTGRPRLAANVIATSSRKRVLAHIMPDGRQPWELLRTKSWHYSMYNLDAMFSLASMGEKVGVDLWHFTGSDGRGLRRALDYLVPYAAPSSPWHYQQIAPRTPTDLLAFLGIASRVYDEPSYARLMERMVAVAPAYHVGNREILSLTDYLLATRGR